MDKPPPHPSKSLEDVVLKFIEKNNRAIWAVIFAIIFQDLALLMHDQMVKNDQVLYPS